MAVDFIDFSCKHDILIRNADGSYLPMDEPYFESEQIGPDTWKVLSSGDYCYILKGDGVAYALDGGYGAGNIRNYMEGVCGLSVPAIINSHDHFDHTGSNSYFDRAYMSELGVKYATIPFPSFAGIEFHADSYERIAVKEGDVIDLPGRPLEVIALADHAPSSLLYLDRKARILFTGDEIFAGPMKPLNGSLTAWVNGLAKIEEVWDAFDFACGGNGVMTKDHLKGHIECAKYALSHLEEAQKPSSPGGPPPALPDYQGHKVYDRKRPHPGDRSVYEPQDAARANHANMKAIQYQGYLIMFDPDLV